MLEALEAALEIDLQIEGAGLARQGPVHGHRPTRRAQGGAGLARCALPEGGAVTGRSGAVTSRRPLRGSQGADRGTAMGWTSRRGELLSRARAIALDLAAIAAGRASVLGDHRQCAADLAGLLGIWLAGGVAVPVHADARHSRRRRGLARTKARALPRWTAVGGEPRGLARAGPDAAARRRSGHLHVRQHGHAQGRGHRSRPSGRQARRADAAAGPSAQTHRARAAAAHLHLRHLGEPAGGAGGGQPGAGARSSRPRRRPDAADGGTVLAAVPTMLRGSCRRTDRGAPALRAVISGGEPFGAAARGKRGRPSRTRASTTSTA